MLLGGCATVDLATVTVKVEASPVLLPGQAAEWQITVANAGPGDLAVQDLDIASSLLAGVVLDEARMEPVPEAGREVVDYRSLRLRQTVGPGEQLVIRLPVTAVVPDEQAATLDFAGDVDICVDNFRQQSARISYRIAAASAPADGEAAVLDTSTAAPPTTVDGGQVGPERPADDGPEPSQAGSTVPAPAPGPAPEPPEG